jgi:hypothetical protein
LNSLTNYEHQQPDLARLMSDKIHYACGRNVMPTWLNVDGFDESYPYGSVDDANARQIYRMDLTKPHPFPIKVTP